MSRVNATNKITSNLNWLGCCMLRIFSNREREGEVSFVAVHHIDNVVLGCKNRSHGQGACIFLSAYLGCSWSLTVTVWRHDVVEQRMQAWCRVCLVNDYIKTWTSHFDSLLETNCTSDTKNNYSNRVKVIICIIHDYVWSIHRVEIGDKQHYAFSNGVGIMDQWFIRVSMNNFFRKYILTLLSGKHNFSFITHFTAPD